MILMPSVLRVVRGEAYRAWRSLRRFGFEQKDLHQEFLLRLVENHMVYDGRLSSAATFSSHVCRRRSLQLVEAATSVKRGSGAVPRSLSEPVNLSTPSGTTFFTALADIISDDGGVMRTGRRRRSAAELMALRIDTHGVVSHLPAGLAAVAQLLAQGELPSEVARRLGISRATLYRRIGQLRCAFREAGLQRYVAMKEAA
jgi:hypothetical protein